MNEMEEKIQEILATKNKLIQDLKELFHKTKIGKPEKIWVGKNEITLDWDVTDTVDEQAEVFILDDGTMYRFPNKIFHKCLDCKE